MDQFNDSSLSPRANTAANRDMANDRPFPKLKEWEFPLRAIRDAEHAAFNNSAYSKTLR